MPPKPPRCVYADDRRQRCRRNGTGTPPLCAAHRIALEAEAARPQRPGEKIVGIIGRVMRGQKVSDEALYAGLEDVVEMFTRPAPAPPTGRPNTPRSVVDDLFRKYQQAQPKPPPPRARPAGPDPRVVLGFAAGQKLTQAEVKKRYRELARKHHPDKGGDVHKMAQVNAAADQLLAELAKAV